MIAKLVIAYTLVVAVTASDLSSFSYGVADPYTGDFKAQTETRADGRVAGQYSLLESDGTHRTVNYAAGEEGFNAIVRKDPALFAAAHAISYAAPALAYDAASYRFGAYPYAYRFGAYPYAYRFGAYPYARYF